MSETDSPVPTSRLVISHTVEQENENVSKDDEPSDNGTAETPKGETKTTTPEYVTNQRKEDHSTPTKSDDPANSRDVTSVRNESEINKSSENDDSDKNKENQTDKDKADSNLNMETETKRDSTTKSSENNSKDETKSLNNSEGTKTHRKNETVQSKDVKFENSSSRGSVGEKRVYSETPKQFHYDTSPEDRYTDSDTTGGKSSVSYNRRKVFKNKKPKESVKSPRSTKSSKSILKSEESKKQREPFSFLNSLVKENTNHRQPTRSSDDSTIASLPTLNTQMGIKKVYVEDTEKLANKYPKRDKDFKLEFVYDKVQKYPSWYDPEKKMSQREEKIFKTIKNVYACHDRADERVFSNAMKMDARVKQIEKIKKEEMREKRNKILATTLEQYEQLKEVREKFEIMCWYRNKTQYITPRVLEHEKLSRHMYGLPESLDKSEQAVKNLRRKNKRRPRPESNRVKSQ